MKEFLVCPKGFTLGTVLSNTFINPTLYQSTIAAKTVNITYRSDAKFDGELVLFAKVMFKL